jgi:hypothetical protein
MSAAAHGHEGRSVVFGNTDLTTQSVGVEVTALDRPGQSSGANLKPLGYLL